MLLHKNKSYFHHSHVRKVVAVFGYIFSNISVGKFNHQGQIEAMKGPIPIRFANEDAETALNRERVNSKDSGKLASGFRETFPRMTYTMDDLQYNPSRQMSRNNEISYIDKNDVKRFIRPPVPYITNFSLNIVAKTHMDALQIFEYIATAFDPYFVVKIKDYPVDGCIYDMPITLTSTSIEDNYEETLENERRVVYVMNFEVLFQMYGPTNNDFEYDALLQNIKQRSGDPLKDNDIERLRDQNSELDCLIDEAKIFNDSTRQGINQVVLKFHEATSDVINVGSDICYEVDLVETSIEALDKDFQTERKVVK